MKSEKVSFVYRYTPYKKNKIYVDKAESVEQLEESSSNVDKHVDNECDSHISNDNDSGYESIEVEPKSWLNKLFTALVRLFYV
jgi:hypothetical protein